MTIFSMTATFGGLQNATLTLRPGLNLLELPNEGGKSTWCAFLRAMFYGLEGRKGGALTERGRYTPWSGAPMSGAMDLEWQGRRITLRRFPKGADPFGGFQAVYTGTEEPVAELTAANVGERVLGMTREVFERTCFIPQGAVRVDKSGDLEKRLAALAGSGEEDISFSAAERRLKDRRNARRSNRTTGTLPRLQAQLQQLEDQERHLLEARQREKTAQEELDQLKGRRREVLEDLARHDAHRSAESWERYQRAKTELDAARQVLAQRQGERRALEEELNGAPAQGEAKGGLWWLPAAVGLALAAVLLLLGWVIPLPMEGCAPVGAALALAGITAAFALLRRRQNRQRDLVREEELRRAALRREGEEAVEQAQWRLSSAQTVWEAVSAQGEPPRPDPGDPPRRDYAEDAAMLERLNSAIARCGDLRARSQGEAISLGDPEELARERAALTETIDRQQRELDALNIAIEALTAANTQLQIQTTPAVSRLAGELLARLTGGRYSALTFTREFQAMAAGAEGPHPAQVLSQGTADQAYLALRLAICLLTDQSAPPLVLDDALVTFDGERLRRALSLLRELAQGQQVLVFTCHDREGRALGSLP